MTQADDLIRDPELSDELKIALISQEFEKEKFASVQQLERRKWAHSTPIAVAFAGAVSLVISFAFDTFKADQSSRISAEQAALEFQYRILSDELKTERTSEERAQVLLFLANAGLLADLDVDYLIRVAQTAPETVPTLGRIDRNTEPSLLRGVYTLDDVIDVLVDFEGGYSENGNVKFNMGFSKQVYEEVMEVSLSDEEFRLLSLQQGREFYRKFIEGSRAPELENVFLITAYANVMLHTGEAAAGRILASMTDSPRSTNEESADEYWQGVFARARAMVQESEIDAVRQFNCEALAFYSRRISGMREIMRRRLEVITPGRSLRDCE